MVDQVIFKIYPNIKTKLLVEYIENDKKKCNFCY